MQSKLDMAGNSRKKGRGGTVVDRADFGPVFGVQVTRDETGMSLHIRKAEIFLLGKSGLGFCEFL